MTTAVSPAPADDATCNQHTPEDQQQHQQASSPPLVVHKDLSLSRPLFRAVWVGVVAVSTLNGLLTGTFALIYYAAMSIRGGYMIESAGLMALENIPVVAAAYAVFAVVFLRVAVEAVVASVRSRRLVFCVAPRVVVPSEGKEASGELAVPRRGGLFRVVRRGRRFWRRLFAVGGPLEVTPETFEFVFLVREVIEITTQSYQAYKCSRLISVRWINNFYVATLALNCWISPIIYVRTRDNHALQRFLYICSDVVLDFASTIVVPISIIFTVVLAGFISVSGTNVEYAFDAPVDDISFVSGTRGVQQVFVVTWADFITKMLPFVSMASCLGQIKRHVQPLPPRTSTEIHSAGSSRKVVFVASAGKRNRLRSAALTAGVHNSMVAVGKVRSCVQCICRTRIVRLIVSVRFVHTLFFLWGVGIVAVHLDANIVASRSSITDQLGCKSSAQPWFVGRFTCTVLEINCYRHGFSGRDDEIASALRAVDPEGISSLIISHCPRLHVPPQIQTLSNLIGLELYNGTVDSWGEDAALVNLRLPALQYMSFIRLNMTELPLGVQSTDFPAKMSDIMISATNLTSLPSDLHTKWKKLSSLFLERTLIVEMPPSIAYLQLSRLSLFENRISLIPDDYFLSDTCLLIISLAKNPIKALPSSIGNPQLLYAVLIEYTEIDELPAWLKTEGERRYATKSGDITVSAGGSKFCDIHKANESPVRPGLNIVCWEKPDEEIQACPLAFSTQVRVP